MEIRYQIEREGGSEMILGSSKYVFVPNEHGHHVCTVTDEDHQKKFLKNKFFVPYGDDAPETVPEQVVLPNQDAVVDDEFNEPTADDEAVDLEALDQPDLVEIAKELGIPRAGSNWSKPTLINAIKEYDAGK